MGRLAGKTALITGATSGAARRLPLRLRRNMRGMYASSVQM